MQIRNLGRSPTRLLSPSTLDRALVRSLWSM